jgi:hypothetical protein
MTSLRASPTWSLATALDDTTSIDTTINAATTTATNNNNNKSSPTILWRAIDVLRPLLRWFVMARQKHRAAEQQASSSTTNDEADVEQNNSTDALKNNNNDDDDDDDDDNDVEDKQQQDNALSSDQQAALRKRVDGSLLREFSSRACLLWQIPPCPSMSSSSSSATKNIIPNDAIDRIDACVAFLQADDVRDGASLRLALSDRALVRVFLFIYLFSNTSKQ